MNFKEYFYKKHNIKPSRNWDIYIFYGPNGIVKNDNGIVKTYAYTKEQALYKFKKQIPFYKFKLITPQLYSKYLELKAKNTPKSINNPIEKQLDLNI